MTLTRAQLACSFEGQHEKGVPLFANQPVAQPGTSPMQMVGHMHSAWAITPRALSPVGLAPT